MEKPTFRHRKVAMRPGVKISLVLWVVAAGMASQSIGELGESTSFFRGSHSGFRFGCRAAASLKGVINPGPR